MSYLAGESGRVFRLLGGVPVLGSDGTKVAWMVSYAGDTREPDAAVKAAEELMASLGPVLRAQGERVVVAQARVGFDPQAYVNWTTAFYVVFEWTGAQWSRLPVRLPEGIASIGDGPLPVLDDASFPLNEKDLAGAGQAASRWMRALAAGDGRSLLSGLSDLAQRAADANMVFDSLAKANKGCAYRELSRMQTRSSPVLSGPGVLVSYLWGSREEFVAILELGLITEAGEWRVQGIRTHRLDASEKRSAIK